MKSGGLIIKGIMVYTKNIKLAFFATTAEKAFFYA
jgi:hypothetical protein